MKRFLPVLLALSFSAIALAAMVVLVRPRMTAIRATTDGLRHKLDEAIETVGEREEADR
jgi:hypothetical protein